MSNRRMIDGRLVDRSTSPAKTRRQTDQKESGLSDVNYVANQYLLSLTVFLDFAFEAVSVAEGNGQM